MRQEIHLQSSIALTQEEKIMLSQCLPTNNELITDSLPAEFYDFSNTSRINKTEQNLAGWQYSFGVDLSTILTLLFTPLPAFFLKKVAEEAGKDFWVGIKKLIKGIKQRRKGIPLKSVQIQLSSSYEDGMPFKYVITYLNAQYVHVDTLTHRIQKAMIDMNALLESTFPIRTKKKDGKIILYALIDGSNKLNIWIGRED